MRLNNKKKPLRPVFFSMAIRLCVALLAFGVVGRPGTVFAIALGASDRAAEIANNAQRGLSITSGDETDAVDRGLKRFFGFSGRRYGQGQTSDGIESLVLGDALPDGSAMISGSLAVRAPNSLINPATLADSVRNLRRIGVLDLLGSDRWADFGGAASMRYSPEIRYWLEGNRWASFGSASAFGDPAIEASAAEAGAGGANVSGGTVAGGPGYSVGPSAVADSGIPDAARRPPRPISISAFFKSIFSKAARQPVVYVILLLGLGLFLWMVIRTPRV